MDCLHWTFSSGFRDSCRRGGEKIVRDRGHGWLQIALSTSRATDEFTDMVITVLEQYRFKPEGISTETGKRPLAPISDQEVICNWNHLAKGKWVFIYQWTLSEYIHYTLQALLMPRSRWLTKWILQYFCRHFLRLLCLGISVNYWSFTCIFWFSILWSVCMFVCMGVCVIFLPCLVTFILVRISHNSLLCLSLYGIFDCAWWCRTSLSQGYLKGSLSACSCVLTPIPSSLPTINTHLPLGYSHRKNL